MMKYLSVGSRGGRRVLFVMTIVFGLFLLSTGYADDKKAEAIFSKYCTRCHSGGFTGWISGAPAVGDQDAWKLRLEKGVKAIKANAVKGVGKMASRGGCKECSDSDIEDTVDYMLSQSPSQKK